MYKSTVCRTDAIPFDDCRDIDECAAFSEVGRSALSRVPRRSLPSIRASPAPAPSLQQRPTSACHNALTPSDRLNVRAVALGLGEFRAIVLPEVYLFLCARCVLRYWLHVLGAQRASLSLQAPMPLYTLGMPVAHCRHSFLFMPMHAWRSLQACVRRGTRIRMAPAACECDLMPLPCTILYRSLALCKGIGKSVLCA